MSAAPQVETVTAFAPARPLDDAALLALGRRMSQADIVSADDGRVRLFFVTATQDDSYRHAPRETIATLWHRAMELVDEEREEARRVASIVPPRRQEKSHCAPLPGFTTDAIWEQSATVAGYLLKFILVRAGLTVLFGLSGALKTVVAVAIAFAVATGRGFFGYDGQRVGVVYIVGEGYAGMRKRARAWLLEHGFDATSERPSIYFTSSGADLIGDPERVRATIAHAAELLGMPIGLVVIDTLTANAGAADLNDGRDMSLAIAGAQRAAPDAAVLMVHHVGHGDPDRERNSNVLIAAADVRLQAIYDEIGKVLELKWRKLKDDDPPLSLLFRPKVIDLGWEDDEGRELTSIVLEHLPDSAPRVAPAPQPAGLGKHQETALKVLRQLFAKTRRNLEQRGDDPARACILTAGWRAAVIERGVPRQRWPEILNALQERRLIAIDGPHVALIGEAQ